MNNEELTVLQTKDLQEYLGIGKDKAYALMRSEGFPSIRIGKQYIITMLNLKNWLNDNIGKTIIV